MGSIPFNAGCTADDTRKGLCGSFEKTISTRYNNDTFIFCAGDFLKIFHCAINKFELAVKVGVSSL